MDAIARNHNFLTRARVLTASSNANVAADSFEWSSGLSTPLNSGQFAALKRPSNPTAPPTTSAPALERTDESRPGVKEQHSDTGKRVAAGVALTLTGLGVVGGLLATPTPAFAAPRTVQAQTQQEARVTAPVRVGSIQDVVQNFDAGHQLYVVGNPALNGVPFTPTDMQKFSNVLKQHPHAYIVLVDRTTDLERDDNTLSRGIGNSAAFQGVTDARTGERDGVVFMLYFNVNGDQNARKIFMRAEALPDKLGVGEEAFAAADGSPGPLMQDFISAVRDEHKHVADALGVVMTRVDGAVSQYGEQTAGASERRVQEAESALAQVQQSVREFQQRHGAGGSIGSPDLSGWSALLSQARQSLRQHDFAGADRLAGQLTTAIHSQQQLMQNYEAAPGKVQAVRGQLEEAAGVLRGLPQDDSGTQRAQKSFRTARSELEACDAAYRAKDPSFQAHLDQATRSAQEALHQAESVRDAIELRHNLLVYGSATLTVVALAVAFLLNARARKARKEVEGDLDRAVEEIGAKSKELLDLMNRADIHSVANYEGKTKQAAGDLMEHVVDALTLVGGCEKFLAESRSHIDAGGLGRVRNWFGTGNYEKAEALLTDPEEKLTFSFTDSSRAVIEKDTRAATWREELQKRGTSREFQLSLQQVLLEMADRHDKATVILDELTSKGASVNQFLDRVEVDAARVRESAARLQQNAPDGLFAAPAVQSHLLARVTDPLDKNGLVAKGRVNFLDGDAHYARPADRMTQEAGAIVALGEQARQVLLPVLQRAQQQLQAGGVKTAWAEELTGQLSQRLNQTALDSLRNPAGDQLKQLKQEILELTARLERVMEQDKERNEQAPQRLSAAEQGVAAARAQLCNQLQTLGYYKEGKPEGVLREGDQDPDPKVKLARQELAAIPGCLDVGDLKAAGAHLEKVRQLTGEVEQLTGQGLADLTRRVAAFGEQLEQRNQRHAAMTASVSATYQPSLDRIARTYVPSVMKDVAAEAQAGDTLADNVTSAASRLTRARAEIDASVADFDQARVLSAPSNLEKADQSLAAGQTELDSVTRAEQLLADKQKAAEKELAGLDGRFAQTRQAVSAPYVRQHARELLVGSEQALSAARSAVQARPQDPYLAQQNLGVAESQRSQVVATVQFDQLACDQAKAAIAGAEQGIAATTAHLEACAQKTWNFQNSVGSATTTVPAQDMAGARSELSKAQSQLDKARSLFSSQDYEAARTGGDLSRQTAHQATGMGDAAVAQNARLHADKVRRLQAQEAAPGVMKKAEGSITAGRSAIDSGAREHWSFSNTVGNVDTRVTDQDLSSARSSLSSAENDLASARSLFSKQDYEASLARATASNQEGEAASSQARSGVAAAKGRHDSKVGELEAEEKRRIQAAQSAIAAAESSVSQARSAVSSAANENWHFSNSEGSVRTDVESSDISSARNSLSQAEGLLGSARSEMQSRHYPEARSKAEQADREGDEAVSEARSGVSSAKSRHDRRVRELEDQRERREAEERRRREEQERREAEERRRREQEERERREAQERRDREERERREAEQRRRDEEERRERQEREDRDRREREERQRREDEERRQRDSNNWGGGGGSGSSGGGWSGGGGSGSRGGSW